MLMFFYVLLVHTKVCLLLVPMFFWNIDFAMILSLFRLDQGISEVHSCPTCRRPLFQSTYEIHPNTQTGDVQNGLQGNLGVNQNQQPVPGQTMLNGTSFGHQQNPSDNVWRFIFLIFFTSVYSTFN